MSTTPDQIRADAAMMRFHPALDKYQLDRNARVAACLLAFADAMEDKDIQLVKMVSKHGFATADVDWNASITRHLDAITSKEQEQDQ